MLAALDRDLADPKVVVFGSQALSFDSDTAFLLRSQLLNEPKLQWAHDVVRNLPELWVQIMQACPKLQYYPGFELLHDLNGWLEKGTFSEVSFPLPNILLTPLVVLTHLVEYYNLLQNITPNPDSVADEYESFNEHCETFGQCTGLLAATAVGCSKTLLELRQNAGVAIRLAVLIGAVIDVQESGDTLHGGSKSFAVQWGPSESDATLLDVLKCFPEAYVSVKVDDNRATVTASGRCAKAVQQHITAAGITVTAVNLRGCFHCVCHTENLNMLQKICDLVPQLQLPTAAAIVRPVRTDHLGDPVPSSEEGLHHTIIRSMLVEQANWFSAFQKIETHLSSQQQPLLVCVGPDCYVPRWLSRALGDCVLQAISVQDMVPKLPVNGVAVIGMSCKVPGADDLEGYWQIMSQGKSQHKPIPEDRFGFESAFRRFQGQKWCGNFVQDPDCFDHRFFQKSPREAAATDPQHRLMLQTAYQAVEQSGYFSRRTDDKHVGCYVGVANVDYERHINCYPANAYSATGNLKSFASGKVSHYFGWTGPSLTIDTACSSSAVAVHYACNAILSGECSSALAGGVNVMTTLDWFENLSGASFLSPTGQCKPFDSNADGYCRGEGVGAVFLKRLSLAIRDGDQIYGIIGGSAVHQNENCTPITVPNTRSLSGLCRRILHQAGLHPTQISYVEAHAPGTRVGDPAEYGTIREVFAGPSRLNKLHVGSVKGVIGHSECASGILSLIKILIMIQKQAIPPQAGLKQLNPALKVSGKDKIEINTQLVPWNVNFRAALLNNFGASGSNACILVTEVPRPRLTKKALLGARSDKYPFIICGGDVRSISAFCKELRATIRSTSIPNSLSVANLSFQLSKHSDRTLKNTFIFGCKDTDELDRKLTEVDNPKSVDAIVERPPARPVVLCFGGQVSTFVGLNKNVYDQCNIFRSHLDDCNRACRDAGAKSIYPEIFQKHPIDDVVKLQVALFSIQYACAKSWIDSGVRVVSTVGLSFGELTALCISGILSLRDAIKLIAGRAKIIKEQWSSDHGAMVAIEADLKTVRQLLNECASASGHSEKACIACYNSTRNFTLSGTTKAIDIIIDLIEKNQNYSSVKFQKLDVTHAFHSSLSDPALPYLQRLANQLHFRLPVIPFERSAEDDEDSTSQITSAFVPEHIRKPAFYCKAVQRLSQLYPSCIWLEAGSNSSITALTRRALGSPKGSHFTSVNICKDNALSSLADTTMTLWKEGLNCSFWLHHPSQASGHIPLMLPPYQFEKHRHWMELKKATNDSTSRQDKATKETHQMWTFLGYEDERRLAARFKINTKSQRYLDHMHGHKVAQTTSICSSTIQLEIAVDALMSLRPEFRDLTHLPEVREMRNLAPMVLDHNTEFVLSAKADDSNGLFWRWSINSKNAKTGPLLHVSGCIIFRPVDEFQAMNDFSRYERMVSRDRCIRLLEKNDADEVIQGRSIYKAFQDVLEYGDMFKGLTKLAGKDNESAGRVRKSWNGHAWIHAGLLDTFCQVAGMFLNTTTDPTKDEMYISSGIDQFVRSPKFYDNDMRSDTWDVFAINTKASAKEFVSDVFIFDARTGALAEVISGIRYTRVSRAGFIKMISRMSPDASNPKTTGTTDKKQHTPKPSLPQRFPSSPEPRTFSSASTLVSGKEPDGRPQIDTPAESSGSEDEFAGSSSGGSSSSSSGDGGDQVLSKLQEIIANLIGIGMDEVDPTLTFEDLGVDSLMAMELAKEIQSSLDRDFCPALIIDYPSVADLVMYLQQSSGGVKKE